MSDLETRVDQLLAAWNEPDAGKRTSLIEQVWAVDGSLVDPPLTGEGHAGIGEMMAQAQAQFPGHRFRRASAVDAHHDVLRYAWHLIGPDGSVVLAGLDVAQVAADGRLQRVTGFFGELPVDVGA